MLNATNPTDVLGFIFGGVLSLLYGVRLITDTMQRDAGTRLRRSLTTLTRYPQAAFGIGLLLTMLTQSSGATSSLIVALDLAVLVSTAVWQVPLHARLDREGFSASVISILVQSNWLRTIMWTINALLLLSMTATAFFAVK
jgi:Na+/Pi-cotransporter